MTSKEKSVAIIGAGPAGCICAYFASENNEVVLFDSKTPLHTLLYTGGGRCNLAYAEYDFKELAKFYPRGEKFLYSAFSQFSTADTIEFFKNIDVETYTQEDLRIFPTSNSAKEVKEKMIKNLQNCTFKREKVLEIKPSFTCHAELFSASNQLAITGKIPKQVRDDENANASCKFSIQTDQNSYKFDKVVIATGGHAGFELAQNLGHKIVEPKPALTGLITTENFKAIQGVSLKNIKAEVFYQPAPLPNPHPSRGEGVARKSKAYIQDDILFTHEGISGPLAYKISSICARLDYSKANPLLIKLNFLQEEIDLQELLNSNPKKDIKNLIAELVPKSLAEYILNLNKIKLDMKCCEINGKSRDLILKSLYEFEINVISPAKEGEVVTSGGVCLDEINPKTMQSKLVEGLYFCGEVIDVDGFCGGFNLQNCWSTGFISGNSLVN